MASLLCRTVLTLRRQLRDSCLYKPSVDVFLRNLSTPPVIKPERFETFRSVFENYGFSDSQISKLAKVLPSIFSCNLQTNILPKLEFFSSLGLSYSDMPKIVMLNPALLTRSTDKQLIPCYNFLKSLVDSDEDIVRMVKRSPRILSCNLQRMVPNLELLGEVGVPKSLISYMITHFPHSVQTKCDKFQRSVDRAIEMGFDPSKKIFIVAVHVLSEVSEQAWDNRFKVYRSFGLSDSDILSAFRAQPNCMKLSEEKITRAIEFYINEMSWSPSNFARAPYVIFYNLERRIIPRCRVVKMLMEKGLVKTCSLSNLLSITDENFLEKFVLKYKNDLPDIMDVILPDKSCESILGTSLK